MLTLAFPWALLLLPSPMLVRRFVPPRVVAKPSVRVPFLERVTHREQSTPSSDRNQGMILSVIIWLLIVLALARPQWIEPPIERVIPTRDLMLLVDLSGSMDQQDFTDASGTSVDRLTALKQVLDDFLTHREGDRVGLVVFGNAPFLQVPFSTDLNLTRQLLAETSVGMAGPRTALGDAIGLGIQLFENSDVPDKTIIALTDGNDNASAVPPTEAARVASDRGITIHTIGMGDPTTVGEEKLDVDELRSVAETTGGLSFLALNRDELSGVYERLDEIDTREIKTVGYRPRTELFHWPLATSLFLSIAAAILQVLGVRTTTQSAEPPTRLRVNTRTFELETYER